MRESHRQKRQMLQDQISQRKNEIISLDATIGTLKGNITLTQSENGIRQELYRKGLASKLVSIESERKLNLMRGELKHALSEKNVAESALKEAHSQLASIESDERKDALKQLTIIESQQAELSKTLHRLRNTMEKLEVRSPVHGLVKGITVTTVGGIITPGQTLLQIVPLDEALLVETQISTRDVGHLRPNQNVVVKVASYDYSRYGTISGKLSVISPSTYSSKEGQSYYKGWIKLSKNYVGDREGHNLILPGMTVQADIITGEKTILQYLLKPIYTVAQGAFHER